MRNLDITALRSLVAIADTHGVTRAAARVNLTQSAVSMQIKRLEQQCGQALLQKDGRGVVLTRAGEQLLVYARQMIALNDEAWHRMTEADCADTIRLGAPADIVYPFVSDILRQARLRMPCLTVTLVTGLTHELKRQYDVGELDLILGTESSIGDGGETLRIAKQYWYGAAGGTARLQTPLPIALCNNCALIPGIERVLTAEHRTWEHISDTDAEQVVHALVTADQAVTTKLDDEPVAGCERIDDGSLPALEDVRINLYANIAGRTSVEQLVAICREQLSGNIEPRRFVSAVAGA
ncbi:MAG: LysR family transcriptional regulator [Pseudomonadota bacterium]